MKNPKRLLLHTCCAPCAIGLVRELASRLYAPTLYFYNPNIHPYSEFRKRLRAVEVMADAEKVTLEADTRYGLEEFLCEVMEVRSPDSKVQSPKSEVRSPESRVQSPKSGVQSPKSGVRSPESEPTTAPFGLPRLRAPARCRRCYSVRLRRAASFAQDMGFSCFTTSLLISPHQNHELIRRIGEAAAQEAGVSFLYEDFRHLHAASEELAKKRSLYRQQYCGCIFSEYDRA